MLQLERHDVAPLLGGDAECSGQAGSRIGVDLPTANTR
jgi:hypothetical protein